MKRIFLALLAALIAVGVMDARKMSDLKIYINPGHGGYTGDDRPIRIYPFESGDTAGYWESKSNLYKGLHMYHILDSLGTTAYLSRVKNTQDDDRSLSGICAEANQLGVDMLLSIHSNAGETVNYPLMLYREETIGTPRYPEAVTLSKIVWQNLYSNKIREWTRHTEYVAGDLTFYQNMWEGGLGVLRTLYTVGLLSEGSMHEHRPEAHRLMNDDIWWLEAWHFVRSIMEFYDTEDRFVTGNVAGSVYDDHNLREFVMPANFTRYGRDCLAPLNFAHLELVDAQGKVVQTRVTDDMYNGAYCFRNVQPGEYKVRAWRDDYYLREEAVTVTANEVTYCDMPLDRKREFPLEVKSYGPVGDASNPVSCSSTIDFEFNADVDTESFEAAFSIEPALEGYWKYTDSYHKASYVPATSLEPNVHYQVTLAATAKTADKHYSHPQMNEDFVFSFDTKGRSRLELIDQFPQEGGEVHATAPKLEFRFDKAVDQSTIFDAVTIRDSHNKEISVNVRNTKYNKLSNGYGNIIYALSGNLTPGESYTLEINTTLRDRENLPLAENITVHFTAVDVATSAEGEVLDDFEAAGAAFAYDPELTTGTGSTTPSCQRSTERLAGSYGAKLSYKFTDTHGGDIQWRYNRTEPLYFHRGESVELFLNGDLNGHEVQAMFLAGSDMKYASLGKVDHLGWQRRTAVLDMLEDGVTYTFAGIRLIQAESPVAQQGSIVIDNLARMANGGISEIVCDGDGLRYDPETGIVTISAAVTGIDIYNTAGIKVRSSANCTVSLASLPAGVYILRAATADGPVAARIARH